MLNTTQNYRKQMITVNARNTPVTDIRQRPHLQNMSHNLLLSFTLTSARFQVPTSSLPPVTCIITTYLTSACERRVDDPTLVLITLMPGKSGPAKSKIAA